MGYLTGPLNIELRHLKPESQTVSAGFNARRCETARYHNSLSRHAVLIRFFCRLVEVVHTRAMQYFR